MTLGLILILETIVAEGTFVLLLPHVHSNRIMSVVDQPEKVLQALGSHNVP